MLARNACPLCQKEKDLSEFRKSHFMPAALYHSGPKPLQYGMRSGTGLVTRHIKDLLLCCACERLLDEGGESHVLTVIAAKVVNDFPLHNKLRIALPRQEYSDISRFSGDDLGINMNKFAYFGLSVVWRASVHDWEMPDGTILQRQNIGDFEPPIRRYLLGDEFPPDTAVIVIACSNAKARQTWNTPLGSVEANCLNFRFLARGVFFRVMMGHRMPAAFLDASCHSPRKCLFYGSAEHRMDEILAVFEH